MPIVPKIAGSASLISSLVDIHKTALIYSKREHNKVMGDNVVAISLGNQKADYISFKDAQRKNWFNKRGLLSSVREDFAAVKGYCKGAIQGIVRYIPKIALSALAIIPSAKHKTLSYVSTIALAVVEAWDFVRYGSGMFEKTDYLERK